MAGARRHGRPSHHGGRDRHRHLVFGRDSRVLKPALGTLAELDFVQPAVRIAAADQFVVGAGVDNAAFVHDHDPIGQGQCRQAVGDDDRGPVARELFQHFVDQLLALQIDLAGSFVQDQDRRIAQDGPGQRDPLALATGELASLGTDIRS